MSKRFWPGALLALSVAVSASCGDVESSAPAGGAKLDAGNDAANDATNDATHADAPGPDVVDAAPPPPPDCGERLRGFDASCQSDDDCALVVLYSCFLFQTSPAIGIRRDQLEAFQTLATECRLPDPNGGCPSGEGIGLAPVVTDDEAGVDDPGLGHPAVQCRSGTCRTFRTSCGQELCGNGALDSCLVADGAYGQTFTRVATGSAEATTEACDGSDLAAKTCQSQGYGSGTLRCVAEACMLSSADCSECHELGEHLIACETGLGTGALDVALAASDAEVAVAWFGPAAGATELSLHLSRFSPELVKLGEVDSGIALPANSSPSLSIAPYGSGWAVAFDGPDPDTIEIHAFDTRGAYQRRTRRIAQAHAPVLVARSAASPLLVYVTGDSSTQPKSTATLLSDDLTSGSTPVVLGVSNWSPAPAAVFTGTGFLFADTLDGRLRTGRIDLAGSRVLPFYDIGYGTEGDYERLAVTSQGPVLLYFEAGEHHWVELDAQGAPAARVTLADLPGLGSVVGFEADVLMASSVGTGYEMQRIEPSGQHLWQARIASAPNSTGAVKAVRVGADVVVGWASKDGLALAKLRP